MLKNFTILYKFYNMHHHLSEQEILRREALQKLRDLGIEPYPAELFPVNAHAKDIKDNFDENMLNFQEVALAGRIMMTRDKGKVAFAELQDSSGRIQLYIQRDSLCPTDDKTMFEVVFKKLLDIGDFIGVTGRVFRTKMGEITVWVNSVKVLAKTLRPLPIVKTKTNEATGATETYDAFTDPDLRYRMRYVDLTVNAQFKNIFIKRSKIIKSMRAYMDAQDWLEVETPILQTIHGGAAARPFKTHHNTLDMPLFLRIANELYLKRLIVAGFDGVYEFGKMFRNEGMDRTHNPEFTVLEFYVAYKDYIWMMDTVEAMLSRVALAVNGTTQATVGDKTIEFGGKYARLSIYEGIQQYTGYDVTDLEEAAIRAICHKLRVHTEPSMGRAKLIDELFGETVEKHLIQPTFVMDHPVEMSPLTKKHRTKAGLVERFELYVNGKEIANAYSELNDPIEQRERFEDQLRLAARGDDEAMLMDEDFVRALEFGMPPTSGIGVGIDRLTMLFTGQSSIQEVLFFPQMRVEKKD